MPHPSAASKKVGLFATCLVNTMRPRVGFAALKLLEEAGFEVEVPKEQTCCGQPNYNSGDRNGARAMAEHFLKTYEGFDYVVVPSGSCGAMVRVHYPKLFEEGDPRRPRMEALAGRTYELVSFLSDVVGIELAPATVPLSVTYHDACSGLRELGIKAQPRALIGQKKCEVKEMEDAEVCCGFGGLFCVKYPEVSGEMVRRKTEAALASGAEALVTGDVGCLLNMEGALLREGKEIKALHIAELLADMTE